MRLCKTISFGFLLGLLLAQPSVADDPGKNKLIGKIYLGHGQILEAAPPRQLSFRANVSNFKYQPGGDAIAFTGAQVNGDSITDFASLADTQHGTVTKLFSVTRTLAQEVQAESGNQEDIAQRETDLQKPQALQEFIRNQSEFTLAGWSAGGKYLLISQYQYSVWPSDSENTPPQEVSSGDTYTCVDLSTSPPTERQVGLPVTLQPEADMIWSTVWWSPQKNTILFQQVSLVPNAKPETPPQIVCTLYDPTTQHLTWFAPSLNTRAVGWLDDTHVLFTQKQEKIVHYFSREVATGLVTESPRPEQFFQHRLNQRRTPSKTSPTNPALVLEEQPVTFSDKQQVATMSSQALWIRRITGPKLLSALPISVSLDPGPYEEWSPTGKQVAYLMHGDLFVSDLMVRDATVSEKLTMPTR